MTEPEYIYERCEECDTLMDGAGDESCPGCRGDKCYRSHVELKLGGEYVYCEVAGWTSVAVIVTLPSGLRRAVRHDQIVG